MRAIRSFLNNDDGGEIIEYALVAGLIIIGAIVAIAGVGTKVLARWNSVNSSSI